MKVVLELTTNRGLKHRLKVEIDTARITPQQFRKDLMNRFIYTAKNLRVVDVRLLRILPTHIPDCFKGSPDPFKL